MCKRTHLGRWLIPPAACLALTVLAVPVAAQTVEQLEARVADFEIRLRDAKAALDASEAADMSTDLDTIRAGNLTIIGTPQDLAFLRPGIEPAWQSLRESLGSDSSLIDEMPLTVSRTEVEESTRVNMPRLLGYLVRILGISLGSDEPRLMGYAVGVTVDPDATMVANVRTSFDPKADESAQLLIDAVWSAIGRLMPPEVVAWSGPDVRLTDVTGTHSVYQDVLTSTVRTGPLCLEGDSHRCQNGLGLTQQEPLDAWYDAEDLQHWVALSHADSRFYPTMARKQRECVDGNLIEACGDFLRKLIGRDLPPPFDVQGRRLALAVAVDLGGDGAIGRLLNSEGSMPERLEMVAGAPLDTITHRWREVVVSAAGQSVVLSATTGAFALVWVVLFGVVGARSAQWW